MSISVKLSDIVSSLKDFEGKTDLVIYTGGLGPTRDDITRTALNDYFGGTFIVSAQVLANIEKIFSNRGFKLTESNRLQAVVPDNCRILTNREGTAPGMLFERNGTMFVSVPGVPYEMKVIITEELIPLLAEKMNGSVLFHRSIMTQGVPESYLADRLSDWESSLPHNIKLAYLPSPGIVRLRLTGIGDDCISLNELLQKEIDKILNIKGVDIFAFEDITLQEVIGRLLTERGETVSTAESCTGGYIASLITSIPGSSDYYKASVITYSNEVKIQELSIDPEVLNTEGAVSKKVVEAMAINVRKKFNTTYSIATSGIAGPGGGTSDKPVGTTWISVSSAKICHSERFRFGDHRGRNIEKTAQAALNMLRKLVLDQI
jgi:nicotinamide-nucleotide amidase